MAEVPKPERSFDPAVPDGRNSLVGPDGIENFYTGSEPFFAFFTQAQILLSSVRLTLESRVVAPTSDLASQMEVARRGFQRNGNLQAALQDTARIAGQFRQRVQTWEREFQNCTIDKRGLSGSVIQRIKSEAALVRGNVRSIERALVKLEVALQQMVGESAEEGSG